MSENRKSVYIESTIPSYATARLSSDLIIAGKQSATLDFWERKRHIYRLVISQEVLDECCRGDKDAAQRRLNYIKGIEILADTQNRKKLADTYQALLDIPDRASTDCSHLAYCVLHKIDMLLTWNCTHLGPVAQKKLQSYNDKCSLWTPVLVTPDSIISFDKEKQI